MSFALTPNSWRSATAVARLCERFGDDYWLKKDTEGGFPHEFHRAMAEGGWLGVAMPEEYGGSGLGITEAAVVMQAVAQSGAGFSGASAVHMNIFGLHPVVVFGNDEQKRRFLPPLIAGNEKACFRGDRARCRARHDAAQDARGARRRPLRHLPAARSGPRPRRSPRRC